MTKRKSPIYFVYKRLWRESLQMYVEPGDTVELDDLTPDIIQALIERGAIEEVVTKPDSPVNEE